MRWFWFLLYLLFCFGSCWYVWDKKQTCCADSAGDSIGQVEEPKETDVRSTIAAIQKDSGPVLFNWSSDEPILSDRFGSYRDSIADLIGEGRALEIQGYYYPDETNNTSFENLGLARANNIKNQFINSLDADRINTIGKLQKMRDGIKDFPFIGNRFRPVRSTATVKEIAETTRLYFDFNSTQAELGPDVRSYLSDVAARVKTSGETINLVGHTDNTGNPESNQTLGLWRAEAVNDYLKGLGVAGSQIKFSSQGERRPAEDNSTEAGRAENRRVDLSIK